MSIKQPSFEKLPREHEIAAIEEKEPGGIEEKDFSFTASDVLKTLRLPEGKKIEYIGSATSDFQAEPLLFDAKGRPMVFSDWEMELVKKLEGKPSKIVGGPEVVAELPHFHQFKEDYIRRSADLGENMLQFSLDFARLCPEVGEFNESLMADYVKALALIRAHNAEPMLAIYHWPMPKYLLTLDREGNIEAGGWEHPDVAQHFRFYVESVVEYLSSEDKVRAVLKSQGFTKDAQDKFLAEGLVRYFLSINEPTSILIPGYVAGIFPPFKKGNVIAFKKVLSELVDAHDIARDEIKAGKLKVKSGEPQVGIGHNWTYFDGVLGKVLNAVANRGITKKFERTGEYSDFLGLQYYFRMTVPLLSRRGRVYGEHPDFGDIYPPGIYKLLKNMNATYPQKEIFVSEFGFSDRKDVRRPYWIIETVRYILEAKKHGVLIKGMLLWSLVNNFEWARGMEQKFGLFDEKELTQPLKPSSSGEVRSWEAWTAITRVIHDPSDENLQALQKIYERAKIQFTADISKV